MSLPNGKASTHSLAMIVWEPTCDNHPSPDAAIRRLQRHAISQAMQDTIGEQSSVNYGLRNPAMSQVPTPSLPSDFTVHQDVFSITLHSVVSCVMLKWFWIMSLWFTVSYAADRSTKPVPVIRFCFVPILNMLCEIQQLAWA